MLWGHAGVCTLQAHAPCPLSSGPQVVTKSLHGSQCSSRHNSQRNSPSTSQPGSPPAALSLWLPGAARQSVLPGDSWRRLRIRLGATVASDVFRWQGILVTLFNCGLMAAKNPGNSHVLGEGLGGWMAAGLLRVGRAFVQHALPGGRRPPAAAAGRAHGRSPHGLRLMCNATLPLCCAASWLNWLDLLCLGVYIAELAANLIAVAPQVRLPGRVGGWRGMAAAPPPAAACGQCCLPAYPHLRVRALCPSCPHPAPSCRVFPSGAPGGAGWTAPLWPPHAWRSRCRACPGQPQRSTRCGPCASSPGSDRWR